MNIDEEADIYQVDTGIVLFPDLSNRYDRQIEMFSLAYVAFNASHFADFVIERPTAIIKNGVEVAQVHHYSDIRSLEAKNTLFCIGEI